MGQRYQGRNPELMAALIEESRNFIDHDIIALYPNHHNWFHFNLGGIHYHFYADRGLDINNYTRLQLSLAVRSVRNELEHIELEGQDDLREYVMPNGSLAARIQIFNREIDLEDMPPAVRFYKHWLFFGHEHPQFANVLVIIV